MKIVMTLLVRDEEDVLPANIDFHLAQGVDFIIATDNLSVDATPEILRSYERLGVLHYIHEPADDYNQTSWVTRMARLAACEHGADWVINNDADEFWYPGHSTLRDIIAAIPTEIGVLNIPRHNFVPVVGCEPFYARMLWRHTVSVNNLGQPLPPKAMHRAAPGVVVSQGNHSVYGVHPAQTGIADIEILHFPLRSQSQFTNKIAKGGAAYARNTNLPQNVGTTWRSLYSELKTCGGLQDYLNSAIYPHERLAAELAAGQIVKDRRLADFLRDHTRQITPRSSVRASGGTDEE